MSSFLNASDSLSLPEMFDFIKKQYGGLEDWNLHASEHQSTQRPGSKNQMMTSDGLKWWLDQQLIQTESHRDPVRFLVVPNGPGSERDPTRATTYIKVSNTSPFLRRSTSKQRGYGSKLGDRPVDRRT